MLKKAVSVLLSLITMLSVFGVVGYCEDITNNDIGELKFHNGEFKILQLTDTQDDQNPSEQMLNLIKISLETVKPDLVVFTGDMVEDSRGSDRNSDSDSSHEGVCVYKDEKEKELDYEKTLLNTQKTSNAILSVINDAKIPFVTAQGNNDHICGVTKEDWLKIYSSFEYCLTSDKSKVDDRIDCNLLIKGSDGKDKVNIWCMDSGKSSVEKAQINWYKDTCKEIAEQNGGENVPSLVFQHIPVKEIGNLFELCNIWDDCCIAEGFGLYRLDRSVATGHFAEVYKTPGQTSKQFKAWKKQGDVMGAYFGHQHYDGYTGKYKGIDLGLTFGSEFAKEGPYGVRVITLYENDIKNYKNELLIYTGDVGVPLNEATMIPAQDESYPVYNTREEKWDAYKMNIIKNIKMLIEEIFD